MTALHSRPRLTLSVLIAVAAVASVSLAGLAAPSASANDRMIVAVVGHWLPIIDKDESAILKAEKTHKLRATIAAYRHEVSDLHHWAAQLKAQSATSRKGATGRNEVVSGVKKVATAYARLAMQLQTTLTKAAYKRDVSLAGAGRKQVTSGIALLRTL